jgi:hypothetical protein
VAFHNKLLRVFLDTNMQLGHKGLTDLAAKHGSSPRKLGPGEHIVFVNRRGNRMKIFSANNVISYKANDTNSPLELGTLQHFAECFGANGFEYTQALKKVLTERLREKTQ